MGPTPSQRSIAMAIESNAVYVRTPYDDSVDQSLTNNGVNLIGRFSDVQSTELHPGTLLWSE